jgi:hypothetical protein
MLLLGSLLTRILTVQYELMLLCIVIMILFLPLQVIKFE